MASQKAEKWQIPSISRPGTEGKVGQMSWTKVTFSVVDVPATILLREFLYPKILRPKSIDMAGTLQVSDMS